MTAHKLWLVIPAAGSGQRMGADLPKQYLTINQKTIIEHTLNLFLKRQDIASVIVCLASDDDIWPSLACASEPKIIATDGGETRAQSVLNGLDRLSELADNDDWVLVHDAARPCLKDDVLQNLIDQLIDEPVGGILAVPAKDTLKQSNALECALIQSTLNRQHIWQAQTPQMFRYKLLKDALRQALDARIDITDEASALESAGYQPRLIEGDSCNLKVTTPDDLIFAEFLLNQ